MRKEKDPERDHATIQLKGLGCSAQVYCAHWFVGGAPGITLDEKSAVPKFEIDDVVARRPCRR